MRGGKLVWQFLKLLLTIVFSLGALTVIGLVFWTQVKEWIYGVGFVGNDTPQFIHYVYYYLKNPHFPVNAWDYFWHNGVPRTVDLTWLHFTLASFTAKAIGVYKTVKIYPIFFLGLGALFVYLLFYQLSRSVLLSLALAVSFVLSQGYYVALFTAGVVLSAIAQMFFPAQLYFLVRFAQGGSYRNLFFASLMSALGLYSHGLLMMFFGFLPSFIFVLFANRESDSLISKKTILNALIFAGVTLTVGALAVWPFLLQAIQGGSPTTFWGKEAAFDPENLKNMFALTDQGIIYGFILSVPIGLAFWLIRKKLDKTVRPILFLLMVYLLWMISYTVGGNQMFGVLFPGRIFWIWPLLLGALTAALLSTLSEELKGRNIFVKLGKFFTLNLLKLVIFFAIIFNPVVHFWSFDNFIKQIQKPEEWETYNIAERYQEGQKDLLTIVDPNEENIRLWSHDNGINLSWIAVSDIPLSEGYAHIWTYYSRLWEGWFYGVMSYPNWESQEIPRDMAKQQSLFFLDWYGVKYLAAIKNSGEWEIAPHFYEGSDYIDQSKVFDSGRSVFVVADNYTSPLISSVNAPVVGFVGHDEAYMTFLKDLAMLNLNTSYLIPVKISTSISGLSSKKLALIDTLVIYDYEKGGFFSSRGWGKVLNFAKNGGRVWIEGGGNVPIRENANLPDVFPIASSRYGPLDKEWQPGGELAQKIDFSLLEPLVYRDTPWQVSYATFDKVKPGARVLLTQKGSPVAVLQEVGKGKVLWTGANFWYRPEEYRENGMKEIVFVKLFLEELLGDLPPKRAPSEVKRVSPENIEVRGREFSGVVFKENYWPGWKATVEAGGKKKGVSILTAGPELMYIPVPKEMRRGEIKVLINYQGDPFHWFTFFVSLISFVVVLDLLTLRILPRVIPFQSLAARFRKKFTFKISQWWKSEEE